MSHMTFVRSVAVNANRLVGAREEQRSGERETILIRNHRKPAGSYYLFVICFNTGASLSKDGNHFGVDWAVGSGERDSYGRARRMGAM
ncbi:hypothetical protein FHR21_003764 [Sphingopyxis panaciterrulae]|uniref:Uncharacterized protein n=1 Tax=Sphingopyxis panaciterrulae TaxID=462372 RepID=A0A7W9B8X6_9SPHN|nr:hypothetical protein [Sphingopyxis panaciterrulae]